VFKRFFMYPKSDLTNIPTVAAGKALAIGYVVCTPKEAVRFIERVRAQNGAESISVVEAPVTTLTTTTMATSSQFVTDTVSAVRSIKLEPLS